MKVERDLSWFNNNWEAEQQNNENRLSWEWGTSQLQSLDTPESLSQHVRCKGKKYLQCKMDTYKTPNN